MKAEPAGPALRLVKRARGGGERKSGEVQIIKWAVWSVLTECEISCRSACASNNARRREKSGASRLPELRPCDTELTFCLVVQMFSRSVMRAVFRWCSARSSSSNVLVISATASLFLSFSWREISLTSSMAAVSWGSLQGGIKQFIRKKEWLVQKLAIKLQEWHHSWLRWASSSVLFQTEHSMKQLISHGRY